MYKIYKKNNYLIIDDSVTTPEEYLTKDILIKEIVTNDIYEIYGILPRLGNTSNQLLYTVNIANIIKENNSPYTANEWVDFYTSSTGVPSSNSSGGGGSGGATIDRELVVTTYTCKTAFSGASVGDTITCTQIIDVGGAPVTISAIWRNQSTIKLYKIALTEDQKNAKEAEQKTKQWILPRQEL